MSQPFSIDAERLFNLLVVIVISSFFIERALALVFENRWFVNRLSSRGIKEPIAFVVSWAICLHWGFDAISALFGRNGSQWWGTAITGAIIAGGSKASIKLFHDVLGAMSNAEEEHQRGQVAAPLAASPALAASALAVSSPAPMPASRPASTGT